MENKLITSQKFAKVIKKINSLYKGENSNENEIKEKEDKYKTYVTKYLENISKLDILEIIESIKDFFDLKKEFIEKCGDEIIEILWKLYDLKSFEKGEIKIIKGDNLNNLINIFLLYNNRALFNDLFDITSELKIKQKLEINKEIINKALVDHKIETSNNKLKNLLIDIAIFFVFSSVELRSFYTSISTFLLNTDSNVILLFKTISLFGLSIAQITKKEDFLSSILYIIGGVLRTHAKSYLKTKGILNENLSEIVCKIHKKGHHSNYDAKILTTLECDFLEQYFFIIMIEFLEVIVKTLDFNLKWDEFTPIYLKNLEIEELDSEEQLPPEITIIHNVIQFLTDFVFSFVTNFTQKNSNEIKTNFDNFQEFIDLAVSIITFSASSPFNIFNISDRKRKIFDVDCEKTEYGIKDTFNHYGLSLIFYYILTGKYSILNLKTSEKISISAIPLLINSSIIENTIKSIIIMFLNTETSSTFTDLKHLRFISFELFDYLFRYEDYTIKNDSKSNLNSSLIFEFTQLSELSEKDIKYLNEFVNQTESSHLFGTLIDMSKNKEGFTKILRKTENTEISKKLFEFHEKDTLSILKKVVSNRWISDDFNEEKFFHLIKSLGKETLTRHLSELKDKDNENKEIYETTIEKFSKRFDN